MYNVPKTISLTILLKEDYSRFASRGRPTFCHVCTKMIDCRKIVEEKERARARDGGKRDINRGTRSFYNAGNY